MNFGDRLKVLREEKKINREDLAKLLNITYSAVSKYETNIRFPDIDTINFLADYFDVTVDYLLGRTDEPNHAIISKEELPNELVNLGYDYLVVVKEAKETGLTADELKELIDFAKKMKEK